MLSACPGLAPGNKPCPWQGSWNEVISKIPPNPNNPAILCSSLCKYRFLWKTIIKVFLGSGHSPWLHWYLGSQAPSCCSLEAAWPCCSSPSLAHQCGIVWSIPHALPAGTRLKFLLRARDWLLLAKLCQGDKALPTPSLAPSSGVGLVPASPNTSPVPAISAPGRIPTQLHMDGPASTRWGISQGTSPNWSTLLNSLCGCL